MGSRKRDRDFLWYAQRHLNCRGKLQKYDSFHSHKQWSIRYCFCYFVFVYAGHWGFPHVQSEFDNQECPPTPSGGLVSCIEFLVVDHWWFHKNSDIAELPESYETSDVCCVSLRE